jgi:hypothetical protein
MNNPSDTRRGYQAEIYFALATIIQGIILTAVGTEVAAALRDFILPELWWPLATGLLSLVICFTFWYIFVRDFYFGFRVIEMNAGNHFFLAAAIFTAGFFQFIAFQFLAEPRLWLALVLASMAVVFLNSWYITHHVKVMERIDIRQAFNYSPNQLPFLILTSLAVVCLWLWYLVPTFDTPVFGAFTLSVFGAALVTLNLHSVKVFQRYLEVDLHGHA